MGISRLPPRALSFSSDHDGSSFRLNLSIKQPGELGRPSAPYPCLGTVSFNMPDCLRSLFCAGSTERTVDDSELGVTLPNQVDLPARPVAVQPEALGAVAVPEQRYGMFTFVDKPDDEDDVIDIVAVHGLGGHYEKTWTPNSETPQQQNWLKDLLPSRVPNARVMSFGYNSAVAFSKSVGDISTFAEQLLNKVIQKRRKLRNRRRPIVFVCHSLGGIVLKRVRN